MDCYKDLATQRTKGEEADENRKLLLHSRKPVKRRAAGSCQEGKTRVCDSLVFISILTSYRISLICLWLLRKPCLAKHFWN